jgi:hypothetical protein
VKRKGYLRVRVYGGDFAKDRTDIVRFYFDTLRRRAAPEFEATWYLGKNPASDTGALFVARKTSWRDGSAVKCKHVGRSVDYKHNVISVAIPRKCLGNPTGVRWSGFTGQITRASRHTLYGHWDDFPRENAFPAAWVA